MRQIPKDLEKINGEIVEKTNGEIVEKTNRDIFFFACRKKGVPIGFLVREEGLEPSRAEAH